MKTQCRGVFVCVMVMVYNSNWCYWCETKTTAAAAVVVTILHNRNNSKNSLTHSLSISVFRHPDRVYSFRIYNPLYLLHCYQTNLTLYFLTGFYLAFCVSMCVCVRLLVRVCVRACLYVWMFIIYLKSLTSFHIIFLFSLLWLWIGDSLFRSLEIRKTVMWLRRCRRRCYCCFFGTLWPEVYVIMVE